jgi:hypothetical protein
MNVMRRLNGVRRWSSSAARVSKEVGVVLDLDRPLDLFHLRKLMFAKFISLNKNIPLNMYLVSNEVRSF